jgi:hypothetical protein
MVMSIIDLKNKYKTIATPNSCLVHVHGKPILLFLACEFLRTCLETPNNTDWQNKGQINMCI